jgi:hypothetical protein
LRGLGVLWQFRTPSISRKMTFIKTWPLAFRWQILGDHLPNRDDLHPSRPNDSWRPSRLKNKSDSVSLVRMGPLVSRPQGRGYEPGQRSANRKASENHGRNRFERVSRERRNHQDQDDADSEGDRIGHHKDQQSNLKTRRHERSLSLIAGPVNDSPGTGKFRSELVVNTAHI